MKNKWNLLYIVLVILVLFSLFAIPRIAVSALNETKGQIIMVSEQPGIQ